MAIKMFFKDTNVSLTHPDLFQIYNTFPENTLHLLYPQQHKVFQQGNRNIGHLQQLLHYQYHFIFHDFYDGF